MAGVSGAAQSTAAMGPVHAGGAAPSRGGVTKAALRVQLYIVYLLVDLLAVVASVAVASALRFGAAASPWAVDLAVVVVPIHALCALNAGAYTLRALTDTGFTIQRALIAFGCALTTAIILLFLLKASGHYSRLALVLLAALGAMLIGCGRVASRALAQRVLGGRVECRVLLIDGSLAPLHDADGCIDATRLGLRPVLDPHMLDRIGRQLDGADRVVVACAAERRQAWAVALKGAGIGAEILMPELDAVGAIATGRHGGAATAVVGRGPLGTRQRIVKRAFDLGVVLCASPLLLVLGLCIAAAVRLDTPGPVLFAQQRVGRGNRLFRIYKFRSMRVDALDREGESSTRRADRRVTRVGRFIRATSLDELPQVLNVLKGDMSIVGPRPHALGSRAENMLFWEVDDRYWRRHAAKPGLTGLAQVRGLRGSAETRTALVGRVQADLEYLQEWSIWRDVRIVAATLRVLRHRNAY